MAAILKPKNFALIGVAGYIAPRHLKAIQDTGSRLVAALDPHDSVGIIDSYFPGAQFFTEFERFDRFIEKLRHTDSDKTIDYVSICSPNHLHDAHIKFALRVGAHAICEKPLVLNPWNIDVLQDLEKASGKHVYTTLQLRVHPALIELKKKIDADKRTGKFNVVLTYITPRGPWYHQSWKGQEDCSGGLATNIGIHLFDLLMWLFGECKKNKLHGKEENRIFGYLELERATVQWYLSIDFNDIKKITSKKGNTHRSLTIDGNEIEFSAGFTDLHTTVYKDILSGNGFGLTDARPSIQLVHDIRSSPPHPESERMHYLATKS